MMETKSHMFIWLVLILFSTYARPDEPGALAAQGGFATFLTDRAFQNADSLRPFSIRVDDQVTGSCLPNPTRLKDKAELVLRRNGAEVANHWFGSTRIQISALGSRVGHDSCVVHISTQLAFDVSGRLIEQCPPGEFFGDHTVSFQSRFPIGAALLTGDRSSMQDRLEKQTEEHTEYLLLKLFRYRDETFRQFPGIKAAREGACSAEWLKAVERHVMIGPFLKEFPHLQGIVNRYFKRVKQDPNIKASIEGHFREINELLQVSE